MPNLWEVGSYSWKLATDLEYADDMALLADSWNDSEAMLTTLLTTALLLVCQSALQRPRPWQFSQPVIVYNLFPSHLFSNHPPLNMSPVSSIREVSSRKTVALTWRSVPGSARPLKPFGSLSHILWYQKKIRNQTKLRIFSSVIIPTLLYCKECAVLLQPHINHLQSYIMRCLRIILGTSVWDRQC